MNLMVPLGVYYRKSSSLNDAEREIATVLIVAKWNAAFAVSEHDWIGEQKGGYSKAGIPTLGGCAQLWVELHLSTITLNNT